MNKDDINNIRWNITPEKESIPGLIVERTRGGTQQDA